MFHLVNDVARYPEFLPWCPNAQVISASDTEMIATVEVAKGLLKGTFTTRNQLKPYDHIDLQLIKGPFKTLQGNWQFEHLGELGCRVHLRLSFEFESAWAGVLFNPIFQGIANTFVTAFCERAKDLYG